MVMLHCHVCFLDGNIILKMRFLTVDNFVNDPGLVIHDDWLPTTGLLKPVFEIWIHIDI